MEKEETSDSFDNARPLRGGLRTGGISNPADWVAAHVRGVTTKIGCIKFLQPAEPVKQSLKTNWPSSSCELGSDPSTGNVQDATTIKCKK